MQKILVSAQTNNEAREICQKFLAETNATGVWAYDAEEVDLAQLTALRDKLNNHLNVLSDLSEVPLKEIPFQLLIQYMGASLGEYVESLPFYNLVEQSYDVRLPLGMNLYLVEVRKPTMVA